MVTLIRPLRHPSSLAIANERPIIS